MTTSAEVPTTPVVVKKATINKKATKPSLKKLDTWALKLVEQAHKDNKGIKALEADANASIKELRKLIKGCNKGTNLTVLGQMQHGMCGKLDTALMTIAPTNFHTLLTTIAGQNCTARRSKPSNHKAMVTHCIAHLKRMVGNSKDSQRILAKVNMADKSEDIANLLAPVSALFELYGKAKVAL